MNIIFIFIFINYLQQSVGNHRYNSIDKSKSDQSSTFLFQYYANTIEPSNEPSNEPSTLKPSVEPINMPTIEPYISTGPTSYPTLVPSSPTSKPSLAPTTFLAQAYFTVSQTFLNVFAAQMSRPSSYEVLLVTVQNVTNSANLMKPAFVNVTSVVTLPGSTPSVTIYYNITYTYPRSSDYYYYYGVVSSLLRSSVSGVTFNSVFHATCTSLQCSAAGATSTSTLVLSVPNIVTSNLSPTFAPVTRLPTKSPTIRPTLISYHPTTPTVEPSAQVLKYAYFTVSQSFNNVVSAQLMQSSSYSVLTKTLRNVTSAVGLLVPLVLNVTSVVPISGSVIMYYNLTYSYPRNSELYYYYGILSNALRSSVSSQNFNYVFHAICLSTRCSAAGAVSSTSILLSSPYTLTPPTIVSTQRPSSKPTIKPASQTPSFVPTIDSPLFFFSMTLTQVFVNTNAFRFKQATAIKSLKQTIQNITYGTNEIFPAIINVTSIIDNGGSPSSITMRYNTTFAYPGGDSYFFYSDNLASLIRASLSSNQFSSVFHHYCIVNKCSVSGSSPSSSIIISGPLTKPISMSPTFATTISPTLDPSEGPSLDPSFIPSELPTSSIPSRFPSVEPTIVSPTSSPTLKPSSPTVFATFTVTQTFTNVLTQQFKAASSLKTLQITVRNVTVGVYQLSPLKVNITNLIKLSTVNPSISVVYNITFGFVMNTGYYYYYGGLSNQLRLNISTGNFNTEFTRVCSMYKCGAVGAISASSVSISSPIVNPVSAYPTLRPSSAPSSAPVTVLPSNIPSQSPTTDPTTMLPSYQPSLGPSSFPSVYPIVSPTAYPTAYPTAEPTVVPTSPSFLYASFTVTQVFQYVFASQFQQVSSLKALSISVRNVTAGNYALLPVVVNVTSAVKASGSSISVSYNVTFVYPAWNNYYFYYGGLSSQLRSSVVSGAFNAEFTRVCSKLKCSSSGAVAASSVSISLPVPKAISLYPSFTPTKSPSSQPITSIPSMQPSSGPTSAPSTQSPSSFIPTVGPTSLFISTSVPTIYPTIIPSMSPTLIPTAYPTIEPTVVPTSPSYLYATFTATQVFQYVFVSQFQQVSSLKAFSISVRNVTAGHYALLPVVVNVTSAVKASGSSISVSYNVTYVYPAWNNYYFYYGGLSSQLRSSVVSGAFNAEFTRVCSKLKCSSSGAVAASSVSISLPVPKAVSSSPTLLPTKLPSSQPITSIPSMQPSSGPTSAPSTQIPSSLIPTVGPTTIALSSIFPTIVPSLPTSMLPTLVPTLVPTANPTIAPSIATYQYATFAATQMFQYVFVSQFKQISSLKTLSITVRNVTTCNYALFPVAVNVTSITKLSGSSQSISVSYNVTFGFPSYTDYYFYYGGLSSQLRSSVVSGAFNAEFTRVCSKLKCSSSGAVATSSLVLSAPLVTSPHSPTPSFTPTATPTVMPTIMPSLAPVTIPPSSVPTLSTSTPSFNPTSIPSFGPTSIPTHTAEPTIHPTFGPSSFPSLALPVTIHPSTTRSPTSIHTLLPSLIPTQRPLLSSTGPSSFPVTHTTPTISYSSRNFQIIQILSGVSQSQIVPSDLDSILSLTISNITHGIFNFPVSANFTRFVNSISASENPYSISLSNITIRYMIKYSYPSYADPNFFFTLLSSTIQSNVQSGRFYTVFHSYSVQSRSSLSAAYIYTSIQIIGSELISQYPSVKPILSPSITSSQSSVDSFNIQSSSVVIIISVLSSLAFIAILVVFCLSFRKTPVRSMAELGDLADLYSEKFRGKNEENPVTALSGYVARRIKVCFACKNFVFDLDPQIRVDENTLIHKDCARCFDCGIHLSADAFCRHKYEGIVYMLCAHHYTIREESNPTRVEQLDIYGQTSQSPSGTSNGQVYTGNPLADQTGQTNNSPIKPVSDKFGTRSSRPTDQFDHTEKVEILDSVSPMVIEAQTILREEQAKAARAAEEAEAKRQETLKQMQELAQKAEQDRQAAEAEMKKLREEIKRKQELESELNKKAAIEQEAARKAAEAEAIKFAAEQEEKKKIALEQAYERRRIFQERDIARKMEAEAKMKAEEEARILSEKSILEAKQLEDRRRIETEAFERRLALQQQARKLAEEDARRQAEARRIAEEAFVKRQAETARMVRLQEEESMRVEAQRLATEAEEKKQAFEEAVARRKAFEENEARNK